MGFPGSSRGKELASAGDRRKRWGFNPWVGKSPGRSNGNPLQYSFLEDPMDTGAWRAMVHRVAKSRTRQRQLNTEHTCVFVYDLDSQDDLLLPPFTSLGKEIYERFCVNFMKPCTWNNFSLYLVHVKLLTNDYLDEYDDRKLAGFS